MGKNQRPKRISTLFWSFFERMGQQGVQFVISIILAMLLLSWQFGLIVMLAIFFAIAHALFDSGFGAAAIEKWDVSDADEF